MSRYSHGNRSKEFPGDDGHIYVTTTVNRSSRLACESCGTALPMKARVVLELDSRERFVAVYCDNDDCPPYEHQMDEGRHPFDLEA